MNERDPPSTAILQEGKNMLMTTFKLNKLYGGGKKKPNSFVYRYLDSALQINPIINSAYTHISNLPTQEVSYYLL